VVIEERPKSVHVVERSLVISEALPQSRHGAVGAVPEREHVAQGVVEGVRKQPVHRPPLLVAAHEAGVAAVDLPHRVALRDRLQSLATRFRSGRKFRLFSTALLKGVRQQPIHGPPFLVLAQRRGPAAEIPLP
jgi:hypothetical protein